MTDFGCCVKCKDNCVVTNEVQKDGEKVHITTCVKSCSIVGMDVVCESCLEAFNKGKRNNVGQIVK